jgi:glucose-6-phosphate 1-dehydrogenase
MKIPKLLLVICLLILTPHVFAANVTKITKEADSCVIVIFGATGDLTSRKLIPAIYNLTKSQHLSENTVVVGVGRQEISQEDFRQQVISAILKSDSTMPDLTNGFVDKFYYHQANFDHANGYESLKQLLSEIDKNHSTNGNRLYYLSTQPSYFSTIIEKLDQHNLIYSNTDQRWSRVIIEKPFGHDLDSAELLQLQISQFLDKDQIYRIDHYLGKKGVHKLLDFRRENQYFNRIWNNKYIDHVQITISEEIGIGTRGKFWEETGYLRDMVQNHLMQLLALVAMEPLSDLSPDNVHQAKIKVINEICPLQGNKSVIRAQYGSSSDLLAYVQEDDVPSDSSVETYMAAKLFIDNDRWNGVPFYIRGGKRLSKQTAEIAVVFKDDDILFIRIQPNPEIFFRHDSQIFSVNNQADQNSVFSEAYEVLIYDCIQGDSHLFVDSEEQIASWRLLTPILNYWKSLNEKGLYIYPAGSWGPDISDDMLQEDNRKWQLIESTTHDNHAKQDLPAWQIA